MSATQAARCRTEMGEEWRGRQDGRAAAEPRQNCRAIAAARHMIVS